VLQHDQLDFLSLAGNDQRAMADELAGQKTDRVAGPDGWLGHDRGLGDDGYRAQHIREAAQRGERRVFRYLGGNKRSTSCFTSQEHAMTRYFFHVRTEPGLLVDCFLFQDQSDAVREAALGALDIRELSGQRATAPLPPLGPSKFLTRAALG